METFMVFLWGRLAVMLLSSSTLGINQTKKQFNTLKTNTVLSFVQTPTRKIEMKKIIEHPESQRRRTNQKRKRRRPPAVAIKHIAAIKAPPPLLEEWNHHDHLHPHHPHHHQRCCWELENVGLRTISITQQEAPLPPGCRSNSAPFLAW